MSPSRRSLLATAAAGTGLASLEIASMTSAAGAPAAACAGSVLDREAIDRDAIDREVAGLVRRSAQSNAALMRGDVAGYRALITLTDDFTLMAPFGGVPTRGAQLTDERWEAMGRFFRNGTLEQEVVQSYGTADMVVLAVVEHARVEVGGLPAQDWWLRVTLVYRRDGDGGTWRLAHRHADPLANGITLEQAAALAR